MIVDEGTVLGGGSGAAITVDADERIVEASDSCAVVFRRPVEEVVDRSLTDLESSGILEEGFVDSFREAAAATGTSTFQAGIRPAPDGDLHVYEVLVEPNEDGTVCSFRDVGTRYRYEETVDSLHGVTRKLMTADSKSAVLSRIGDAANEVLGFPGVGVRKYDPETETLEHVSFGGIVNEIDSRPGFDVHDSPHGRAFRTGETVIEKIPDEDDPFDREEFSHTMYVPIGEYGVLSLGRVGGPFDRADVHFAEILAENGRAALQQVEQKERLREQRRRLEERNERLDEFASVVSHDLRNPLSVAKGALQGYQRTDEESFVGNALEALDRMDDLIEDALALAREGLSEDEIRPVSLPATARGAWQNVDTGDVDLVVETDRTIEGDPARLQRLFENLFRNSVEHGSGADDGISTVTVGDFEVGFFVADDGAGIDPDVRDHVLESGYTTTTDGTGYGLAIVARIAEAHGFDVEVGESDSGGARIEVVGTSMVDAGDDR